MEVTERVAIEGRNLELEGGKGAQEAAGGRIPGGWFKREGRPTEKEILTARLIYRPLRPLFPKGYTQETQIVGTVLSADGANDPDVLAINGASTALMVSGAPFDTPVGAVRVAMIGDQMVLNPTNDPRAEATLEIVVAGTEDAVVMVEAAALGGPGKVGLAARA